MNDISDGNSSISQRLAGLDVGAREEADDPPTRPLRRLQPQEDGALGRIPQRSDHDALSGESGTETSAAGGTRLNAHLPVRAQPPAMTTRVEPPRIADVDMQQARMKIGAGLWTVDEAINELGVAHEADVATLRGWQAMTNQFADEPPVSAETADAAPDRGGAASIATADRASTPGPGADPAADLAEARKLLERADGWRFSGENDATDLLSQAQECVTRARDSADEIFTQLLNAVRAGDTDTRQAIVRHQAAFLRQATSCARQIDAARVDPSDLTSLIAEIGKMARGIDEVKAP
ncbi:hypothetical protein LJR230_005119 [Trinickia sp. LjRoot230]|uniref:hypothetical protein n=1 Tax=Trinickia sp. LjRoot230 TaxID=3342288 RepID=UPI003ED100C8